MRGGDGGSLGEARAARSDEQRGAERRGGLRDGGGAEQPAEPAAQEGDPGGRKGQEEPQGALAGGAESDPSGSDGAFVREESYG